MTLCVLQSVSWSYLRIKSLSLSFILFSSFFFVLQDLYKEIISQARTVAASIRTATEKLQQATTSSSSSHNAAEDSTENSSPASSGGNNKKEDGAAKGLERRYHLLYLKAIEVQCVLENLLERRQSPVSVAFYFYLLLLLLYYTIFFLPIARTAKKLQTTSVKILSDYNFFGCG